MTSFITRSGSQLLQNGQHFRFAGVNIYWLGLSNVVLTSGGQTIPSSVNGWYYPSRWAINDALSTAKEMGMTVVRSHYLGISVGDPLSVCPALHTILDNQPNLTAFNTIDYAIYQAGQLGLRLIIPFVDNHYYNKVGKRTFTNWRGLTSGGQGANSLVEEQVFFTESQIISDFQRYIALFLNRVNQFNGLAYKDDPTIMTWETGNEINPPPSWTNMIASYIKSIDRNHLVMDGYSVNNTDPANGTFTSEQLNNASVDIVSSHFYPPYNLIANNDAAQAAGISPSFPNANPAKAYLVGEYKWTYTPLSSQCVPVIDTETAPGSHGRSVKLQVTAATNDAYMVQLLQALGGNNASSSVTLVKGATYVFSFYAKATGKVANRTMYSVVQMSGAPYNSYGTIYAALTSHWQQYSVTFVMAQADNTAEIAFNVGDAADTTWITGVSLVQHGQSTNLVQNPNFSTDTSFNSPPWVFHLPKMTPNDLQDFLHNCIEVNPMISGACLWSLMPHFDTYGFCTQQDGFSMYYPNGLVAGLNHTVDQAERMQIIRAHGYKLQGYASPPGALSVKAPVLTVTIGNPNIITWTGVVGANAYVLERAMITSPVPFPFPFPFPSEPQTWSIVGTYTDFQTPVKDHAANSIYRVRAQNVDGRYGLYSLTQPAHLAHANV